MAVAEKQQLFRKGVVPSSSELKPTFLTRFLPPTFSRQKTENEIGTIFSLRKQSLEVLLMCPGTPQTIQCSVILTWYNFC